MREANKFIHGLLYLNRGGHGSLCSYSQQVKIANPQIIYINNPYAFRPPPYLVFLPHGTKDLATCLYQYKYFVFLGFQKACNFNLA